MRALLALALSTLLLAAAVPAQAQEVQTFENPAFGLSFEYPANWTLGLGEPRPVLPNQLFQVRADGDPATAFLVAVYQLGGPVDPNNLEATVSQLDSQFAAWLAGQPGGDLLDSTDMSVDDADGRAYTYEYQLNGQLIHADTILVVNGDRAFEISPWAREAEYDDRL